MTDTNLEQTEPTNPIVGDAREMGTVYIEAKEDNSTAPPDPSATVGTASVSLSPLSVPARTMERAGTVEHLAARRSVTELDVNTQEMKQRLSELRSEVTTLLTDLRWGGGTVEETAEHMLPLLNVGSVQQWKPVLIPFLLEIDRAGNLIPIWVRIIEREDATDLPPDANPAETMIGRARRFAILMLGNYKYVDISHLHGPEGSDIRYTDLSALLGRLALDPNTSLYATQSLVKQSTTGAIQALISALKDAEGWAKVDVVEGCLALGQTRFYDIVVASGLDRVPGLESYVAIPIYRTIPLENYLRAEGRLALRLSQQAALIFAQVVQDSMTPPTVTTTALPPVFERSLSTMAHALFDGARRTPNWQYAVAIHRLAAFLGRYWSEISKGAIKDPRVLESVYACLPMMPDVERWMAGPGRDVLLATVNDADETALTTVVKVLGELREPRAISALLKQLEQTQVVQSREQALYLGSICDALGRLGDLRATTPLLQLLARVVPTSNRIGFDKRRDNLLIGDPNIPASVIYAAVIRACGQLGDINALDTVLRATHDFDPYVRLQAIEALKRIDPRGEDAMSRMTVREALNDPRDTVVRAACQLVIQYHDTEAVAVLQQIIQTQPELAPAAYDALRQLGR
jgi:hypothetical protein